MGFVAASGIWAVSYGLGLLVFDPQLRALFETGIWLGKNFCAPMILGSALAFSGRKHLANSRLMWANLAFWAVATVIYATHPLHPLVWTTYQVTPVLGAATTTITPQPLLYGFYALAYAQIGLAFLLLFETLIRYGSRYRMEIFAVTGGILIPWITSLKWLFDLGPLPALNLTPAAFMVTVLATSPALFRGQLFDIAPSTRRAADRAALDDIGSAVVIVTPEDRIVDLNATAQQVFSVSKSSVLGDSLARLLPTDEMTGATDQVIDVQLGGQRRVFKLSRSPLADRTGDHVGSTLVFQDVTFERQREEQLGVLTRILRDNLRNEITVARGNVELALEYVTDERAAARIRDAIDSMDELLALGRKARSLQHAGDRGDAAEAVEMEPFLRELCTEYEGGTAGVTVTVPAGHTLRSDPELLGVLFGNLIENSLDHTGPEPEDTVSLVDTDRTAGTATYAVRDNGPGFPQTELDALDHGREDKLEHGSGLGLWLVKWSATMLGGSVTFSQPGTTAVDGPGAVVRVTLPGLGDSGHAPRPGRQD
jgi:signal transduction histidine kinase